MTVRREPRRSEGRRRRRGGDGGPRWQDRDTNGRRTSVAVFDRRSITRPCLYVRQHQRFCICLVSAADERDSRRKNVGSA